MPKFRLRSWALLAAILGLGLVAQAKEARASTFEVNPIRIQLSSSSSTSLLTVHNTSKDALRFQVSAFSWDQNNAGEMRLASTNDVVFFPAMLALKPGESRRIRVGTLAAFGATEKSYRIFVEELPGSTAGASNSIRVLTRFGIPVFIAPTATATMTPHLDALKLAGRTFSFALKNDGNTHFLTRHVRVSALSASGDALMSKELPAWYLLAGGLRAYTLELPNTACGAAKLVVSIDSEASPLEAFLAAPAVPCGP